MKDIYWKYFYGVITCYILLLLNCTNDQNLCEQLYYSETQQKHLKQCVQFTAQTSKRINSNHNSSFLKSIILKIKQQRTFAKSRSTQFVDRTHQRTPFHYKSEREKAQAGQDEFLSGQLKAGPNVKLPLNMRYKILAKEKIPLTIGKNPRTENKRLQEQGKTQIKLITHHEI
ncbi:unnamed protein product (macronuclear) [Paramecium tetraurelia]|uniref:Uncharacterized protein n=1 Tax=Paramecium tetraurelia TaxID=5888 RepID=A0E1D2_PARTE|nr:uncharacterized protein GSPATT00022268001 [Paramecium tetraurelia]CAK89099.1 unnamed protein product [Paramecium tetraurelia]|eukprot:XP_001456496.1 hypothetical protein (macronuclear) [Paramecium tetraurelia strain d4-2]